MLNNKIKNILLIKDMSPSRFADEIGIQRSIISHILSGRNRPSLEVVQKIIRRFPELGMDWIVEEDETLEEIENEEKPRSSAATSTSPGQNDKPKEIVSREKQMIQEPIGESRKIEKILIFYSDKTFTEYRPD